jgi:hypothetical protein
MWNIRAAAVLAFAAILLASGSLAAPAASAQDGDVVVTVAAVAPEEEIKEGGDPIAFDVTVENVENLGGFQFVLLYNNRVLEFDSAQKGDFAGSTGREVVCNDPITAEGSVRLSCNTLRPEPAGPDGGGKLMTVMLKPTGAGNTEVLLDRVKLVAADESASDIGPITTQTTAVSVEGSSGFNWMIWGPVIGVIVLAVVGVGAFAAMRLRGDTQSTAAAT